ncbi:hypothetical protein Vafri_12257 [Volvox africanus]|uniref:Uncharacterized protein n=1 Tax=Volvox africanus TaxID=51714 RepID=A0A8J4F581_9CHLO|nr:hypothetical protein Vafri_12257 [Volvox africanus]
MPPRAAGRGGDATFPVANAEDREDDTLLSGGGGKLPPGPTAPLPPRGAAARPSNSEWSIRNSSCSGGYLRVAKTIEQRTSPGASKNPLLCIGPKTRHTGAEDPVGKRWMSIPHDIA